MKYCSDIHTRAQRIKAILGTWENRLGGIKHDPSELLVLNYHGTQKKYESAFWAQVEYLTKYFQRMNPDDLSSYYSEPERWKSGPYFLLTFDDGIQNNQKVLNELAKRSIGALMFLVPDFIKAQDQPAYFQEFIRPIIDFNVDGESEDRRAMSLETIREMIKKGHRVGCHTMTHGLTAEMDSTQLNHEIISSKELLEQQLGINISGFCSPNDSIFSVSPEAAQLIAANYEFHFTTLPASNRAMRNPMYVGRINVEAFWPTGQFLNAIGSWDRRRWAGRIQDYQQRIS